MSQAKTPTLPWVLPMYEHMLKHLKGHVEDQKQLATLRYAAGEGLTKLEGYYEKARGCQFNVIATSMFVLTVLSLFNTYYYSVLHPYLGIAWFRRLGEERARLAEILFRHAFDRYQEAHPIVPPPTEVGQSTSNPFSNFLDGVCMVGADTVPSVPDIGEYERYLAAAETFGRGNRNSPLEWWKVLSLPSVRSGTQFDIIIHCRLMRKIFRLWQKWHATFSRYLVQVSP